MKNKLKLVLLSDFVVLHNFPASGCVSSDFLNFPVNSEEDQNCLYLDQFIFRTIN